jgi:Na+/proline symporter
VADAAAPTFLLGYVSPALAGLVFAGLFAAIMSTADGFLNIGAAALVHDLPRALRGRPFARELRTARLATVILAAVAAWIAFASEDLLGIDLVGLLGAFGWATFAAALVPVVAIGFNWKRATAFAANASILFSLACNIGLEVASVEIPHGISGGAISLVLSLILFIAISLLTPARPLDPDIEAAMDL